MFKRLCLALAGLFALVSVASGAGTIPGFSLTPQFDLTGVAAPGCKLYVIQAGTTATPQNAYSDSGLTSALPNPLTCDAAARLPQFFVADGLIKVRLTKSNGSQIFVGDNLTVVGASSGGGGGGGSVDPTTVMQTGHVEVFYGAGVLSGFVRANGRTIGSATSGATERANSDVQALFVYLWGADANLAVSGGRGASAAADWAANKTITLPDWRGKTIAGLGDMGNSATSIFTSTYAGCTTSPTTLGAFCGSQSQQLQLSQLPTGITSGNTAAIALSVLSTNYVINNTSPPAGSSPQGGNAVTWPTGALVGQITSSGTIAIGNAAVTSNNTTGNPHSIVSPTMLATIYLKL